MQQDKIFTSIRDELQRRTSKYSYNKLVDLVLSLGLSKQVIVNDLIKNKIVCKATAYNYLNHKMKRPGKALEARMTDILRMAVNESVRITQSYKKFLTYETIDNQVEAIKDAKAYLATLDTDIPLEVIAEESNTDYLKQNNENEYLNFIF
jgi:hypothetical protein